MADTSLIFNIIARDSGVGRALDAITKGFRGAGRQAEEALGKANSKTANLDRQIQETRERIAGLAAEFEKTGDKRLFGQISRDRSLLSNLERIRSSLRDTDSASSGLSGAISRVVGAVASFGGALAGAGSTLMGLLGPMGVLAVLAGAVTVGLFAAGGAVGVFGGAMAALPGMLSGAIAAIATLKLGLFGLGENWKAMNAPGGGGGGGGGAAKIDITPKLRAVEAAQRAVARSARDITDAQAALREATERVNEARVAERERIEDVGRALASARADQARSEQSLAEARMQLALAEGRGNPDEIRRAQIAVDEQAASLEEAKDKTEDLQKESDEAAREGVEGSDAVVEAKKREQDAQRRVQDAVEQHRLAIQQLGDAQKSLNEKMAQGAAGAGGLAQEIPRISRSAQAFLNVLKELKPAFEDLRLDIQERLFAGLADKLRILAGVWIPQLKISLGSIADTINGVVKTAFDSLSRPQFVQNIATGLQGFNDMLGKIGQAVAGPLIDAFGRLSAASVPFLGIVGDKLAGIITRFSEWIAKADDSGALGAFMEKAASITGHVLDIFEDLARIAGSVMDAIFGSKAGSTDGWKRVADAVDRIANWFGRPENKKKISDFVDGIVAAGRTFGEVFAKINDHLSPKGQDKLAESLGSIIGRALVAGLLAGIIEMSKLSFKSIGWVVTWVVDTFKNMLGIKSPSTVMMAIGANVMTGLVNGILGGISWLWRAMTQIPSVIWNALRNMGSFAWQAARNVVVNISNALRNLGSLMWNAGYNAAIGIWNGITGLAGWLWSKVYNLGVSMWNAFMRGIGARSPSVKFAQAGAYAVLGAVQGVEANKGKLLAAAQNMAEAFASTRLALPGVEMGLAGQLASASGSFQMAASTRQQVEVVGVVEIRGDGELARVIRKSSRVANLYQKKG